MVRAGGQTIEVGKLTLAPPIFFEQITTAWRSHCVSLGKHVVGGERLDLFLAPPSKAHFVEPTTEFPHDAVIAYFLVGVQHGA